MSWVNSRDEREKLGSWVNWDEREKLG